MRSLLSCVIAGMLLIAAGCSDDSKDGFVKYLVGVHTGVGVGTAPPSDDGGSDGGADSGVDLTPTKQTSANVTVDGVMRAFERGQFGMTKADGTFYIEGHAGGVAECPEKETPKWTVIVSGVPKGSPGATFTQADGVTVSFLDFSGELIVDPPPTRKATAATVTLVASKDEESVEVEVDATFDDGSVKGRVYATYCAAMSE